jgi:hypothetical protein
MRRWPPPVLAAPPHLPREDGKVEALKKLAQKITKAQPGEQDVVQSLLETVEDEDWGPTFRCSELARRRVRL